MTTSMTTHVYTDQQLFDGMDRLRRLHKMAQRRTHVDALPATFHEESPALRRGLPHWHPENIQAAVLYPVNVCRLGESQFQNWARVQAGVQVSWCW